MRFSVLYFAIGVITTPLTAQNLVLNPSFEEVDSLPCGFISDDYGMPTISAYVKHWLAGNGASTDIYSLDVEDSCIANPRNVGQQPHSGQNVAAIITADPAGSLYREYLQTQLEQPLQKGKYYYAEMFVLRNRNELMSSNNLGMYFSDTLIEKDRDYKWVLPFSPQVNESMIIDDPNRWTKVSGCFMAESDAAYLLIGNFFSTEETDTAWSGSSLPLYAYYFIDDVYVEEVEALSQNGLGNDTLLCAGNTIILDASVTGATYQWEDYSTEPTLLASVPGTYWVDITVGNCTIRDSINVSWEPSVNLGRDALICYGETLMLDATHPNESYRWSDNTTKATLTVSEPGTFWVQIPSTRCPITDSIRVDFVDCPGLIPTVFTPNQDAFNETFVIEHVAGRGWQLQVFNRWGKQVYSADNYRNDWDGQHLSAGVYYYLLKNQPLNRTYRGWVHLLRNPS